MPGDALAFRLEIRSTETRPSEETQQSVLPAMSQKFGQGIQIEKAPLGRDSQGTTIIGNATTQNATLLLEVYEYLKPNDLVKVGDIVASDGSSVVTRRLHETDQERIGQRSDLDVLGEAAGSVLIRVRPEGEDGSR